MKITFEDREWVFDEDAITIQQGIAIHLAYGFTISAWLEGMTGADPRAWQCAYWLMLQQNGVIKPIKDCDGSLVAFMSAYAEASREDLAAPEAAPDPTSPSPTPGGPPSPEPASPTITTPPPRLPAPEPIVS